MDYGSGSEFDREERYKSISISLSLSSYASQCCFLVLFTSGELTDGSANSRILVKRVVGLVIVVKMDLLLCNISH
jgi:hypothetical protein